MDDRAATVNAAVRGRRLWSLVVTVVVVGTLPYLFGHRGVHAVRSMLVPGAGLYDHRHAWLGAMFTLAAIAATVCWLRWGMDWLVCAVVVASMAAAAALAYTNGAAHPGGQVPVAFAAHEFPLVVLVMGVVSGARVAWSRSPIGRWQAARSWATGTATLSMVDRCRAASITALAAGHPEPVTFDMGALTARCRRVGIAARGRCTGDPLRVDHAHVRTTLLLAGQLNERSIAQFRVDAAHALTGVPSSEPGWTRLLDGTLAACALHRDGDEVVGARWSAAMRGPFALRHAHRPGQLWNPLALRGPRATTWEHATATGLARAVCWLHDDADWRALRTRVLAAAARGNRVAEDERLVAAGRIWLTLVDDEQASRILRRVTIGRDGIAVALDSLATALQADPDLLAHVTNPHVTHAHAHAHPTTGNVPTLRSTRRTP
jgi:hypothetical protein